jgi:hypothetical protein
VTILRTERGAVVDRIELKGFGASVTTMPASPARGWRALVSLGSPAAPLDLQLTRSSAPASGSARARLWLTLDATSVAASAKLDLRMVDQTFAPSVSADHWFHAEAAARFDAAAGRTEVTIDHTEAGDGAASAEASIEIPDTGDPLVRRAQGEIDGARLLRWVPAGLVPLTAEKARLRYQIDSLAAGATPRLAKGGSALVDAELANVDGTAGGPIHVDGAKLSVHAEPTEAGGIAGRGSVQLAGLRLASGEQRVAASKVDVDLDGQQEPGGALTVHVGAHLEGMTVEGPSSVAAPKVHVDLRVQGLRIGADDPLTTQGDIALALDSPSLDARSPAARVDADGFTLRAHTRLDGHAPYALETETSASRLRVLGPDDAPLLDSSARIDANVRDAFVDLARPLASRAVVHTAIDLGDAKTSFDATKERDAVAFTLRVAVPSLGVVRPFLAPALATRAPWEQMTIDARSTGRVEHLFGGAPVVQETSDLTVERAAFDDVAARSVSLKLRSTGSALAQDASAELRTQGLTIGGGAPSDDHMTLSATVDRDKRSLRADLATEGRVAAKIAVSASFDASRRAVPYTVDAHLAGLAPLAPLLAKVHGLEAFDVSQLEVGLASHGAVLGAVADVGRDGALKLEPHLSRTAGVEGSVDLHVAHFHWEHGDNAVIAPKIVWHGDLHAAETRRTVASHLELDSVHLDLGPKDVDLNGVRDDSTAVVTGDLAEPQTSLTERTTLGEVVQDVVPAYPIGDVTFALVADRESNGLVHVSNLNLGNGAGGTTVALSGNVELGAGRHTLSVSTTVAQDLAHLARVPDRFAGHGTLTVEASVVSPDLSLLRVRASMKAHDVTASMRHAGLALEGANGEVPITVTLVVDKDGVALARDEAPSPYSMLRFTDQHPLMNRSGFLSITRLATPLVTIAPLVGNLEIEQRAISLRQFEMGIRGGSITGQCGLNLDGAKSTLELHVRATGVQSSHGEPFDGNIAVIVSAGDRTVEGRAEVLRIGERHLLDLLDMQDPTHVDSAMNRIRTALLFGYPDRLRLVFDHGFASAKLELGGLAQLVSIGELRGIPMGPIVDKFLAPLFDTEGRP